MWPSDRWILFASDNDHNFTAVSKGNSEMKGTKGNSFVKVVEHFFLSKVLKFYY